MPASKRLRDQALVWRSTAGRQSGRLNLLVLSKYQYKVIGLIGRYVQDRSESTGMSLRKLY